MNNKLTKEVIKLIGFIIASILFLVIYMYIALIIEEKNIYDNIRLIAFVSINIGISIGWGCYSVYKYRKKIIAGYKRFSIISKITFEMVLIAIIGGIIYKTFFHI